MRKKIDWQEKLRQFQASKMTKAAWCRSQGIPPSTFHRYVNKTKVRFIELKPSFRGIKLRFNNTLLKLDADFDIATLKRFLKALE